MGLLVSSGTDATMARNLNAKIMTDQMQNVMAGQSAQPEGFIAKPEVAKRMQRTVRTIDNLMKRRLIPFYKIGRSVSFKWSEIEAHLRDTCRVLRRGVRESGVGRWRTEGRGTGHITPALSAKGQKEGEDSKNNSHAYHH